MVESNLTGLLMFFPFPVLITFSSMPAMRILGSVNYQEQISCITCFASPRLQMFRAASNYFIVLEKITYLQLIKQFPLDANSFWKLDFLLLTELSEILPAQDKLAFYEGADAYWCKEPKLMELIADTVFAFCRDSSESDSYHGQAGVGSLHALQARHRKRGLSGGHQ